MSAPPEPHPAEPPAVPPRASPARDMIAFILVGGLGAVTYAGLSVLAVGLGTGIPDWIVSVICYALLIGPVYLAHRRFSFRSNVPHRVALPRYVAVQANALCLAAVFSYICYDVLGLATAVAALVVTGLTSGVSFILLKLWAFARRS